MKWEVDLDRRELASVKRLYSQLRPKLLRCSRKQRDVFFIYLMCDREVVPWTLMQHLQMKLQWGEQTRPLRETGWRVTVGGQKGGKKRAAERPDTPAETRKTFAKVMQDTPGLQKTAAVKRVAESLGRDPRTVWNHLKKSTEK